MSHLVGGGLFGGELFGGPTSTTIPPDKSLCDIIRQLIDQPPTATSQDDPTVGDIFWVSQQIYDAANEAILDLEANAKIAIATASMTFTQSNDLYALPTSTIMIPQFLVFTTNTTNLTISQKYWITSHTKLEQYSRVWRQQAPAFPRFFVLWDLQTLRCWPIPNQTYIYVLWGVAWPQEITSTNEDWAVDRLFKLAIAFRAAAELLEYTRPDVADKYHAESEFYLQYYKRRLRNRFGNNLRRLKPGNKISNAYKGTIRLGEHLS